MTDNTKFDFQLWKQMNCNICTKQPTCKAVRISNENYLHFVWYVTQQSFCGRDFFGRDDYDWNCPEKRTEGEEI